MKKSVPTVKVAKPHLKKLNQSIRVGKGYSTHKQFKF